MKEIALRETIVAPEPSESVGNLDVIVRPATQILVIPYSEFKRLPVPEAVQLPPGTLVQGVKPRELFTLQDWLEPEKAARAIKDFINDGCVTQPIGYAKEVLGKQALVIGEGVHRSGCALVNGMRVDVRIELPREPFDLTQIFRLSTLIGRNPTIARLWREGNL